MTRLKLMENNEIYQNMRSSFSKWGMSELSSSSFFKFGNAKIYYTKEGIMLLFYIFVHYKAKLMCTMHVVV